MSLKESLSRARAVRAEAAKLALDWAVGREAEGDPEGADVLRDLAAQISRIYIGPRK